MYRCFLHSWRGCYSWKGSESDVAQRINLRGRTMKYLLVLETDTRSSEEWARQGKAGTCVLFWDLFIFWFARGLLIWDKISLYMPSSKFELAEILLSWNFSHKPPGPDTSHVRDWLEELPTLRRPFWEPWDIGSIGLQASSRATVCARSPLWSGRHFFILFLQREFQQVLTLSSQNRHGQ